MERVQEIAVVGSSMGRGEGSHVSCSNPDATVAGVAEIVAAEETAAVRMLTRLRGAVLRAFRPASMVFQSLAPCNGRLAPHETTRILREFDNAISDSVAARVFSMLDVDNSGYIEQADWVSVLELPQHENSAQLTDAAASKHDPAAEEHKTFAFRAAVVRESAPASASSNESKRDVAELLGRVAFAVRRSGRSPATAFRALSGGKPLNISATEAMLRAFDAAPSAVAHAAIILDANESGLVEVEDFSRVIGGLEGHWLGGRSGSVSDDAFST